MAAAPMKRRRWWLISLTIFLPPVRLLVMTPLLILFGESLDKGLAVGMKEFLAAFRPSRLEFGRGDVPVGPAFLENGAQVLAKLFHRGTAEEPVAHVDFVD